MQAQVNAAQTTLDNTQKSLDAREAAIHLMTKYGLTGWQEVTISRSLLEACIEVTAAAPLGSWPISDAVQMGGASYVRAVKAPGA